MTIEVHTDVLIILITSLLRRNGDSVSIKQSQS